MFIYKHIYYICVKYIFIAFHDIALYKYSSSFNAQFSSLSRVHLFVTS